MESHFEQFSYGHASDSFAQKGFLYTKILVGEGKYLHLINTHLNASYYDKQIENLSAQIDVRVKSLEIIRDYFQHVIDKTDMNSSQNFFMLCGDLNIDSFSDNENLEMKGEKTPVLKSLFKSMI